MKLKETLNVFIDIESGIFNILKSGYDFDYLNANVLDKKLILEHGERTVSPMYLKIINYSETSSEYNTYVAEIISSMYKNKWDRINQAITSDYNPINNYDMVEEENQNSKVTSSNDFTRKVNGFNSTTGVPSDSEGSTSTVEGNFDDNHRKLTRSGNIGVTTSQQMITSEIELRKYNFYNEIIKDVLKVITLSVYEM